MRRKLTITLGIIFSVLLFGGVAYASIPGPDNVIHGCYKTNNPGQGAVIVVDSAASCPSGFTILNWNQIGPQGPAGANGTNGVSGYETVLGDVAVVEPGNWNTTVICSIGKKPLGGGFSVGGFVNGSNIVTVSRFNQDGLGNPNGWFIEGENHRSVSDNVRAWVICGTVN
jgi:hypothetical protein